MILRLYERRLAQARADLAHINAAITIFNTRDGLEDMAAYVDIHRVWKRGHLIALCKGFLKAEGPLDTAELTKRAMTEAGLDTGDKVLARSIAFKIIHAMRQQRLRGTIKEDARRKGRNKLSRGAFTAAYFLQCLEAIGVRDLRLT